MKWLCQICLMLSVFSSLLWAGPKPIRRFIVVVPVYRELYNQNITGLLLDLSNQQRSPEIALQAVFLVNNTDKVSQDIRLENQQTVSLLLSLQPDAVAYKVENTPRVAAAIDGYRAHPFGVYVLDHTTPGTRFRNIGRIRDMANQAAFQQLGKSEYESTVIAQMDADTRLPDNFVARVSEVMSLGYWDYLLLNLAYQTEEGADRDLFRRTIVSQLDAAAYNFSLVRTQSQPTSGSPRIIARASLLKAIHGISHLAEGEDTDLVTRLRQSGKGLYLPDVTVTTAYRGRADGYDASYYLSTRHLPVTLSKNVQGEMEALEQVENEAGHANRRALLLQMANEERAHIEHRLELTKADVERGLAALIRNGAMEPCVSGLCATEWFPLYLKELVADLRPRFADNLDLYYAALPTILRDFPHLTLNPVLRNPEIELLARFNASARYLLLMKALEDPLISQVHQQLVERYAGLPSPGRSESPIRTVKPEGPVGAAAARIERLLEKRLGRADQVALQRYFRLVDQGVEIPPELTEKVVSTLEFAVLDEFEPESTGTVDLLLGKRRFPDEISVALAVQLAKYTKPKYGTTGLKHRLGLMTEIARHQTLPEKAIHILEAIRDRSSCTPLREGVRSILNGNKPHKRLDCIPPFAAIAG